MSPSKDLHKTDTAYQPRNNELEPNKSLPSMLRCRKFMVIVGLPIAVAVLIVLLIPVFQYHTVAKRLHEKVTLQFESAPINDFANAIQNKTSFKVFVTSSGFMLPPFSYQCKDETIRQILEDLHMKLKFDFYICGDTIWIHNEKMEGVLMHYERIDRFTQMGIIDKIKWYWLTDKEYHIR